MLPESDAGVFLVTQSEALQALADRLMQQPVIAVDTESNSLFSYRERVCLVQFSTSELDYLVDPLALADLSPLAEVFASPRVEKVFHAAEYDILCLKRDFGFKFNYLFDTMLAARILGREVFGLGNLLETEFGVHQNKRFQRANWGQRPLPADMLEYARLDTRYLIALRERLAGQLKERGLELLAQEDFTRMTLLEPNHQGTENGSAAVWQVRGAADLSPRAAAILAALCAYREEAAQGMDRPLFKVIGDKTLIDIATGAPKTRRELGRILGMTPGQLQRHGTALLQAVQKGLKAEPLIYPRPLRLSDAILARQDRLRLWRKEKAAHLGVSSDVVLPRDLMELLARRPPRTLLELAETLHSVPYRHERFGAEIFALLEKKEKQS